MRMWDSGSSWSGICAWPKQSPGQRDGMARHLEMTQNRRQWNRNIRNFSARKAQISSHSAALFAETFLGHCALFSHRFQHSFGHFQFTCLSGRCQGVGFDVLYSVGFCLHRWVSRLQPLCAQLTIAKLLTRGILGQGRPDCFGAKMQSIRP